MALPWREDGFNPAAMSLLIALLLQAQLIAFVGADPRFLPQSHIKKQYPKSSASSHCWGYEPHCSKSVALSHIVCDDEDSVDPLTGKPAEEAFFEAADFGYVKAFVDSLTNFCEPRSQFDSSLTCSENLQFCTGRNLFLNFSGVSVRAGGAKKNLKYSMDVLAEGEIGGKCRLKKGPLRDNFEYMAPLQSWAPELRNFVETKTPVDGSDSPLCDVFISAPTIVMKLDATVSMYHHFCDFFNLYASLLINSTFHKDSFDLDVNILVWENLDYQSSFEDVFNAFTVNPILNLDSFEEKTVCFKNLLMPLLPRMPFGLFYNTPIIDGCRNSGLFQAFSEFVTYRLGVHRSAPIDARRLRVTMLSRRTKYRRVLNENSLVSALTATGRYDVRLAHFTHAHPTFVVQMQEVRNTDILVGMHGAGLTHLLFLPDWACVFELYDCGDPGCYTDLARLRGVHRVSWDNPDLVFPEEDKDARNPHRGHAKFMNYAFDEAEFVRKIDEAAELVRQNKVMKDTSPSRNKESLSTTKLRDEL